MISYDKHIRFDWAMKRLLRQKSNFVILEGFLSELLMQDVIIEDIIESQSNQEYKEDKYNNVDILVKSKQGELMLVEVQNNREHDYFHRMNYGQAKLITEHIHISEKYGKIKKIYSINIVYFELGQGDDYIYYGKTEFIGLHNKEKLQLSKKQKTTFPNLSEVSDVFCNYFIIKVNNFDDVAKNTLDEWIYFLKNSEIRNEFTAKGLAEAKEKMRRDDMTPDQKYAYDQFIKEQRIKAAELDTAIADAKYEIELMNEKLTKAERDLKQAEHKKEQAEQEKKQAEQEKKQAEQEKKQAEQEKKQAEYDKNYAEIKIKVFKMKFVEKLSDSEIAQKMKINLKDIEDIIG